MQQVEWMWASGSPPRREGETLAAGGGAGAPRQARDRPSGSGACEALPPFDQEEVQRQGADAHRAVADARGAVTARCSLWWRRSPGLAGHRLGVIGHYAATTRQAGVCLLDGACSELAARGCTLAVGPMDGSTWRRYRLVTESDGEPAFFLEPENPAGWPEHFVAAGFGPLAQYYSAVTDQLEYEEPKACSAEARLKALGVELRPLDLSRWEAELREVHRVSTASFQGSFLYQPLPEGEFLAQYEPLRPCVEPDLVQFAMHRGRAIGFVFGVPDRLQASRKQPVDTVILKTLGVLPDRAYAGLGRYLTQQTHRVAARAGYRRVIHALMHEANASLNLSARYGRRFRRYTLWAKPL